MPIRRIALLLVLFCLLLAAPVNAQDNPPVEACGLPLTGNIYQSASYTLTSHCDRWSSLVVDNGAQVTIQHNGFSFRIAIGNGRVTTITPAGVRIDRTSGMIEYIARQQVGPETCDRLLGGIASICVAGAPERAPEIWGVEPDERANYLLRVTQAQVDAVAPGQRVTSSADGRIALRVEHDGHITISMGPDQEDKTFDVTLEHTLSGQVIGSAVTYDGLPGEQALPRRSVAVVRQSAQEDGSIVHVVQTGHTPGAIARAYAVRVQDIVDMNDLPNRNLIHVGQELLIQEAPRTGPVIHFVRSGDSIEAIALAYGVEALAIIERNQLPNAGLDLQSGQGLVIPYELPSAENGEEDAEVSAADG
ncbi:MAG: LysM peptidoglycan-binding domain-containing protein [Anaerolineae bacterium]|nr:LysM peptidoglycan-binding domain-containing protein [Anaerolineae bacterium]